MEDAFQRISAEPEALTRFGRLLLDTALTLDTETVRTWHTEALDRFTPLMPSRVVNNLACCTVGLKLTEAALARLGLGWDQVFPIPLDMCENWLQCGTLEYLLEGRVSNKTVVEQSLEIMDRMGLTEDECRFLDGDNLVALHVKGFYDRFTRYIRENGITTEHLQYNQFIRQLKKSQLFREYRTVRFGDGNPKLAIILDYKTLKEVADVDGFLKSQIEPL